MAGDTSEVPIDHAYELSQYRGPRRSGNTFRTVCYALMSASAYGRAHYYVGVNPDYNFRMAARMVDCIDGAVAKIPAREIVFPNGGSIKFVRRVEEEQLRGSRPEPDIIYDKD